MRVVGQSYSYKQEAFVEEVEAYYCSNSMVIKEIARVPLGRKEAVFIVEPDPILASLSNTFKQSFRQGARDERRTYLEIYLGWNGPVRAGKT